MAQEKADGLVSHSAPPRSQAKRPPGWADLFGRADDFRFTPRTDQSGLPGVHAPI